jgi:hypothetical protein
MIPFPVLFPGTVPAWAQGADLWQDFVQGRGSDGLRFPPGVDTHAQTIMGQSSTGVWQPFGANVPVLTNLGLQTVPTRTNSLRNNSMVGAVAGTPGTLPTNWTLTASGLTRTIVGTGVENGLPYIDIRIAGTSSDIFGNVVFELGNAIAASNTQVWAESVSLSLVGGSFANVTSTTLAVTQRDGGGAFLSNLSVPSSSFLAATAQPVRYGGAVTLNNASVATIQPGIAFGWANGAAIDFTIRIAAPQLELGAFASPPILTTNAAVTVNGNQQVVSGLGAQLATGVAGLAQFTILQPSVASTFPRVLELNNGAGNDYAILVHNGGNLRFQINTGGVNVVGITLMAWPSADSLVTVAFSAKDNYAIARAVGQSLPSVATSFTYPPLNAINFGSPGFTPNNNGYQFTRKAAFEFLASGDDPATKFAEWFAKAQQAAAAL